MKLFNRNKEQVTEPVLEEVVFEDDELFEEDLDKVIGGVPTEFAQEKLSELDQMMSDTKPVEETESKQK